jgi:hypothetical protein
LANFFKDKINSHLSLFILIEEEALTLSVFNSGELLYAEYIDMQVEVPSESFIIEDHDIEDLELHEEGIDLDEISSLNDIDELDDFGDIEDLDSIDDLDEFDVTKDIEEELTVSQIEIEDDSSMQDTDGLNEDYQRFSLVQSAIKNFYKDEKYASQFIENIYIGDGVGVSNDLKKYFEEEMFLNVYIRHLHLANELCEMAKMELS